MSTSSPSTTATSTASTPKARTLLGTQHPDVVNIFSRLVNQKPNNTALLQELMLLNGLPALQAAAAQHQLQQSPATPTPAATTPLCAINSRDNGRGSVDGVEAFLRNLVAAGTHTAATNNNNSSSNNIALLQTLLSLTTSGATMLSSPPPQPHSTAAMTMAALSSLNPHPPPPPPSSVITATPSVLVAATAPSSYSSSSSSLIFDCPPRVSASSVGGSGAETEVQRPPLLPVSMSSAGKYENHPSASPFTAGLLFHPNVPSSLGQLSTPSVVTTLPSGGATGAVANLENDQQLKKEIDGGGDEEEDVESEEGNDRPQTGGNPDNSLSESPTRQVQAGELALGAEDGAGICNVCGDGASGRHYGANTCFGCKGFFRRTVRANKRYQCRYEEKCNIDKVGRNICRSCRFRKCLEVGMEPEAIRPDRDKTGKQRNPRRSILDASLGLQPHSVLSHGRLSLSPGGDEPIDVEMRPEPIMGASVNSQDHLGSACEDVPSQEATSAEGEAVIGTLLEIERICCQLRDATNQSPLPSPQALSMAIGADLSQVIARSSVVSKRTELDYSGSTPVESSSSVNESLRRLLTLSIDYANTLKPIADIDLQQRVIITRNFFPSFTVFTTVARTVFSSGRLASERVFLPNGQYIEESTPDWSLLSTEIGYNEGLESRLSSLRQALLHRLQRSITQLELTETEFVALKAIMALDPNTAGLSVETARILLIARESVQQALFLHLMGRLRNNSQQAVSRFGRLLMLLSDVGKIGVQLTNLAATVSELGEKLGVEPEGRNRLLLRFLLPSAEGAARHHNN